jgi:RimJ/RimL family protein N-acetyltransferase
MDNLADLLKVQHTDDTLGVIHNLGVRRLTPFDSFTCTPTFVEALWAKMRTQDYVFDDFYRGNEQLFAESLLNRGAMHFIVGEQQGYAVVRNLYASDNAELHYCIWDRKMAFRDISECGTELVNFLFKRLKVARITAPIPINNPNAKKFATMLGFKFEGTIRKSFLFHDKRYDIDIYGLLKEDWLMMRRYNNAQRN